VQPAQVNPLDLARIWRLIYVVHLQRDSPTTAHPPWLQVNPGGMPRTLIEVALGGTTVAAAHLSVPRVSAA
jgi:hypothetical protein